MREKKNLESRCSSLALSIARGRRIAHAIRCPWVKNRPRDPSPAGDFFVGRRFLLPVREEETSPCVGRMRRPRFAISTCTSQYGRYISVRQVAGMRNARYQAVPPKIDCRRSISAISGRLREKSTIDDRLREKSSVGDRLREKKGRRRKKKRGVPISLRHPCRRAVIACGSPAPARRRHPRVTGAFPPHEETEHLPARGERSR
ncbi:hypothetical protein BHM03_00044109 [Ensete ventricosum]|nr:hypothetical protein BHM03_00044109 [Ensete ventricosum]